VIKGIVIGFILAIALSVGCVFIYFSTGLAPVATADPPMPFEEKFANMALDAHIEKQHIPPSSVPADATSSRTVALPRDQTSLSTFRSSGPT
jgi:hypothetical protein